MLSVCLWADQSDGDGQTGKLAYMDEHTHRAARGVSPGERNKLFDLFFPPQDHLPLIRGKNKNHMRSGTLKVVTSPNPISTLVPGGHYHE